VKHVTKFDEAHLQYDPFPELHWPPEVVPVAKGHISSSNDTHKPHNKAKRIDRVTEKKLEYEGLISGRPVVGPSVQGDESSASEINLYLENRTTTIKEALKSNTDIFPSKIGDMSPVSGKQLWKFSYN